MEIEFKRSEVYKISEYVELYKLCFPNAAHLKLNYLEWLYRDNPEGKFVGVDAIYEDKVIGQVVSVPTCFKLDGALRKGLIAVNVVVHPSFQGRHLFKKLGLKMCDEGASEGYSFVMGVSNAAATLGWTRQMGFQLVKPLDAVIGVGSLGVANYTEQLHGCSFEHVWNSETLKWRCNNPFNPITVTSQNNNYIGLVASAGKPLISAYAEIVVDVAAIKDIAISTPLNKILPKVFLGLIPNHAFKMNYQSIPPKFRASPLNFIYKNLMDSTHKLDASSCFINFLDFDAF